MCHHIAILLLGVVASGQLVRSAESPIHPDLSESARASVLAADIDDPCELPESAATEIEGLLLRPYDALTIQTEAEKLIQVYARCVAPSRAADFLAERVDMTEDPMSRVWLLRGLGMTEHPAAVDAIVRRVSDDQVYMSLVSADHKEDVSVRAAAATVLRKLFPNVEANGPTGWHTWWSSNRERYSVTFDESSAVRGR